MKKCLFTIIFSVAVLAGLPSFGLNSILQTPDEPLKKAVSELRAGRPLASLEFAVRAVEGNPRSAQALAILGLSQLGCGEWQKAETSFHKALTLDARLPEAYLGLGKIAAGQMKNDEAISHLRKSTNSKDFKGEAYMTLALCLEDKNLHREAKEAVREAAKYKDHLPEEHQRNLVNYEDIFASYAGRRLYGIPENFKSTTISFRIEDGHIAVPFIANGYDLGKFIVDTGYGGSLMISNEDAKKLDLVFTGKLFTRSLAGEHWLNASVIKSVKIGDLEIHDVPVYACENVPFGLKGLIGWQLLRKLNISYDFKNSLLHIFNPKFPELQRRTFSPTRSIEHVPFFNCRSLWIMARFGEDIPRAYIFDTGCWTPSLHEDPSHRISPTWKKPPYSFQIGNTKFKALNVDFFDFSSIQEIGRYYFFGVIGIRLFRNAVVHINPQESIITIEVETASPQGSHGQEIFLPTVNHFYKNTVHRGARGQHHA